MAEADPVSSNHYSPLLRPITSFVGYITRRPLPGSSNHASSFRPPYTRHETRHQTSNPNCRDNGAALLLQDGGGPNVMVTITKCTAADWSRICCGLWHHTVTYEQFWLPYTGFSSDVRGSGSDLLHKGRPYGMKRENLILAWTSTKCYGFSWRKKHMHASYAELISDWLWARRPWGGSSSPSRSKIFLICTSSSPDPGLPSLLSNGYLGLFTRG
jgi:hypothetical protein